MERKEAIRSAYRLTGGNNFYDGMITCSTLSGKAVCRLVWDMNKVENDAYLEKAGFCKIQSHKNKKGWLCVTAQKR